MCECQNWQQKFAEAIDNMNAETTRRLIETWEESARLAANDTRSKEEKVAEDRAAMSILPE